MPVLSLRLLPRFAFITALACFTLVLPLAGCDNQKIVELTPGEATEADVRNKFGTPDDIWEEENGARVLEYSRQPEGHRNYQIAIDAQGKLIAVKQILTVENVARVKPGMSELEIRRLIGKPGQITPYKLSNTVSWDYRFLETPTQSALFTVTFDANTGKVTTAGRRDDPKAIGNGPN
jgi:hypothetical protein